MEKRVIVIPAYNEEKTIGETVRGALDVADRVLVVDDGSTDRTSEIASAAGATVVRHAVNRGLGGALGTGIEGALRLGADAIVTMDADGQHRAEDAKAAFARLTEGDADFVIGSRMLEGKGNMPARRRFAQLLGNALTYALFRKWVTDSQSGLRGMTRHAAERIRLRSSRMEVSSEFVKEVVDKDLRLVEIPIMAIYTEYSLSKGQNFAVGMQTALKLILRRLLD
ncbi:MAG TPA: glycosyltransferase family 2 protein [Candidatus Baltobacteraceae bacterium]|nr:glycosyltransferase family 2 protein [Candidatus Baltobacteraceae bacterium]